MMNHQNFYDSPSSSDQGQKGPDLRLPIYNGNDLTLANINNIYDEIKDQLGLGDQVEEELSPLHWEYDEDDQDQELPEETLINTPPPPIEGVGDMECVDPLVGDELQLQDQLILLQDNMPDILEYDYGDVLVPVPEVPAPQPHEQKPLIEMGRVLVTLAPVQLAHTPIANPHQQVSGQIQVPDPGTSTGKGNRRRGRPKGSSNKKNGGSSSPPAPIQLSPRNLHPAPVPLQPAPVVTARASSSIASKQQQQSEPSSTTPKSKRLKKWQEAELTQENRNAKLAHQTRLRQQREKAETNARIKSLEEQLVKAQSIQALQAARIQQLESQNSKLANFAYRSAALCGPLAHKIWTYIHGRFPGRSDGGTGTFVEVQLNPGILNYDPNIVLHARSQFTLGILEAEVPAGSGMEKVVLDAVPMSSILPPQSF